jgi:hypothetical protein
MPKPALRPKADIAEMVVINGLQFLGQLDLMRPVRRRGKLLGTVCHRVKAETVRQP